MKAETLDKDCIKKEISDTWTVMPVLLWMRPAPCPGRGLSESEGAHSHSPKFVKVMKKGVTLLKLSCHPVFIHFFTHSTNISERPTPYLAISAVDTHSCHSSWKTHSLAKKMGLQRSDHNSSDKHAVQNRQQIQAVCLCRSIILHKREGHCHGEQ